jgi:cytoskeletal protein RodZ
MQKRIKERRKLKIDFRKIKLNNRKKHRRKVDKINYSVYYIILFLLGGIIVFWFFTNLFLGGNF